MHEDKNRATIPTPDMEPDIGNAALSENGIKKMDSLVSIRVISYRRLNHDPDGVSAKAVLDGLVHAGILADDSTKQIKEVTFESRKSKEERTTIEIEPIEE